MRHVRGLSRKLVTFLHEYPVLALGALLGLGAIIILWNFFQLAQQVNQQLATQYAGLLARMLEKAREEYSTQVTDRIQSQVLVTDDYYDHAMAIPFPATFSINLANRISAGDRLTRIYSDYPFPSRQQEGGPRDAYEVEALQALRRDPETPFARIETVDGRLALRFAQAIRLREDCVECHNTRYDSPKIGWRTGDVRGVQEIILPLNTALSGTVHGLVRTLGVMLSLALMGVGLLAVVVNKLRTSLRTVEGLAQATAAANQRLSATNSAYDRFVPHEFLRFLDKESIIDVQLGDHIQKEMTILFSDIRSFTTMSEQMTPEENFQFINDYLSAMGPIVREHGGFIDKYIGDAIMALFLRPEDAIKASIAMLQQLRRYNEARGLSQEHVVKIGIGLNTGNLMLGTIGESNRMEGTVISDAVNLAARMEGLTKLYGANVLISQQTLQRLEQPEQYLIREIDHVKVKGKEETVVVYEVYEGDPSAVRGIKALTQSDFETAVKHYQGREFHLAKALFESCWHRNPADKAAEIYLKRCQFFLQNGYTNDWDGITHWDVK